jgi:hypothetical protein
VLFHKVGNRLRQKLRDRLVEVYRGKPVKGFDLAPYLDAEREAREAKKGIWGQGIEYVSPRDWRKGQSPGLRRDRSSAPPLEVISGAEGLGY